MQASVIKEIGSSSTANGSRDLVLDIKAKSLKQQFSLGVSGMIIVPDYLRNLDAQAFTPKLISIGPIHCSNPKLQIMKKWKERFFNNFIRRANINYQNLADIIRTREVEIRSYYAETVVSSISSDDFVKMILVDGMFILEYFLRQSDSYVIMDDPMAMIAEWMPSILKFDLVLLENQLPFFVLEMLFQEANFGAELSLRELAFEFFQCYNFQRMAFKDFNAEIEHFTDLIRLFYLSEQLPGRRSGGAKLSYSATQLHETGVKFKGVEFDEVSGCYESQRNFLDIRFDLNNEVLEIPCIKLNDERVRLIRNIIALEQSIYVGHAYVTDFFVILELLIYTTEDVDLLCDKGILVNYLGDSNIVALVLNSLNMPNSNILGDHMNVNYSKICEDLNEFYKHPWQRWRETWYRWRETLWLQYFNTPWRAASTSAAIILLVLTAIQTVCTLKSTKW